MAIRFQERFENLRRETERDRKSRLRFYLQTRINYINLNKRLI